MKWLALSLALAAALPFSLWLHGRPFAMRSLFFVLGVLPFLLSALFGLNMALVSLTHWFGYVQGFEVTLVDICALILLAVLPRPRCTPPFRSAYALFALALAASVLQAAVPAAALAAVWQFARVYLLYLVVARAVALDPRFALSLLGGMTAGLFFEAGLVIWQRFGLGVIQTTGTFVHQNTLGLVAHLVIVPQFALLLAVRTGWQPMLTPMAGVIIAVLTASRAALGLGIGGLTLMLALSSSRRWTRRKALIAAAGVLAIAIIAPAARSSLEARFAVVPLSDEYQERTAFETAARSMLDDHPWGVGANHYVHIAKSQGYSERAGVAPSEASQNAHVHHVYWLVASETGFVGLFAFLVLLLRPMFAAFVVARWYLADWRGDLLLGFATALATVYVHSLFEWILISAQVQYFFAMITGMIAGLVVSLRAERSVRPAAGGPSQT